ncbi:MAG: hypothetical protein ACT4NV_07135 [Rhodoferax sp.]
MNPRPLDDAQDPDIRLSLAALQRAARRAHQLAVQTGTPIAVSHSGVLEYLTPPASTAPAVPDRVPTPPSTRAP